MIDKGRIIELIQGHGYIFEMIVKVLNTLHVIDGPIVFKMFSQRDDVKIKTVNIPGICCFRFSKGGFKIIDRHHADIQIVHIDLDIRLRVFTGEPGYRDADFMNFIF